MAQPQVPKYQAIYTLLRQQILDGEFAPGARLPPQQELADSFSVTLMTLRQAVGALESEGLIWAARGKGTFVADRPIDISIGNLSSFSRQMQSAGIEMTTEVLDVQLVPHGRHEAATAELAATTDLYCVVRRRSVGGSPFSLQRSYLAADAKVIGPDLSYQGESLYEAIEAATGWSITKAEESITAVVLGAADAATLSAPARHPALLSIRTSINQFDRPFLYDEALLVGGRCKIAANRSSDRLSLHYGITGS